MQLARETPVGDIAAGARHQTAVFESGKSHVRQVRSGSTVDRRGIGAQSLGGPHRNGHPTARR
jgi:hypothetical protein